MNNNMTCDVVILGGGVAGCATALFIKKYAPFLNIVVVEKNASINKKQKLRIGETIPPHTAQLLHHLELWQTFLSHSFLKSYGTTAAWGEDALYHNEYIYSANGYGWHLDRNVFDHMMLDACACRGISILSGHAFTNSKKNEDGWDLYLANADSLFNINTRFVVDATGKQATFAKSQGARKIKEDAMVGIYQHYEGNSNAKVSSDTIVETCKYGWWYTSNLPGNKSVVSFMTDGDIAHNLNLTNESAFHDLLQTSLYAKSRIASSTAISNPEAIAAQTHLLDMLTGDGWIAVGDAASAYDTISSMGIFKSLSMSQYAAFAVIDFVKGNDNGLIKYQKIVIADYKAYQIKKHEYYNKEQRFSTSLFWKRRQHQHIIH